jgi:hypothetical protein
MYATVGRTSVLAAVGCILLTGCGATTKAASRQPASAGPAGVAAAPTAAVGGSVTACDLVTQDDASTAIGTGVGPGKAGGNATLSECIYDDGSLIVAMETNSKTRYDTSHTAAVAHGSAGISGVGDSAFARGTDQGCTLMFLKGTTLVNIIFTGTDAQARTIAVAKVAAAKL